MEPDTRQIDLRDWLILDALSDDYESVEQIIQLVVPEWSNPSAIEIINRLECLYREGLVFLTLDTKFDRAGLIREIEQTRDRKFWFGRSPSGDAIWTEKAGAFGF